MFKLEFKEIAAALIVVGAAAIALALLGTNPLDTHAVLDRWVRLAFGGLGIVFLALAIYPWLFRSTAVTAQADPQPPAPKVKAAAAEIAEPDARSGELLIDPIGSRRGLQDFDITFSDQCRADLERHGLDTDHLLGMVAWEFMHHVNYFLYDLEDYILPVRSSFLVLLDKTGDRIIFRGVKSCTTAEAKLESWKEISAVYRRASRLAYRTNPGAVLRTKGMLSAAAQLHEEIAKRVWRHMDSYGSDGREPEIKVHLNSSTDAIDEARTTFHDHQNSLIDDRRAVAGITTSLETSLQHLHKILILLSPEG